MSTEIKKALILLSGVPVFVLYAVALVFFEVPLWDESTVKYALAVGLILLLVVPYVVSKVLNEKIRMSSSAASVPGTSYENKAVAILMYGLLGIFLMGVLAFNLIF